MKRELKLPTPPDISEKPQDPQIIVQEREYKLITPLFGGGISTKEVDPITPIRGTGVRGQLRFWWRACRGGQYAGSLKEMKAAEDAIWGKAGDKADNPVDQKQLIQVYVKVLNSGKPVKHTENDIPAYAAFPMQDKPKDLRDGISFSLTISFPEDKKQDVEAALWAWETFGGVGSRTRRGFGAIHCISIKQDGRERPISYPPTDIQRCLQWVQENLTTYINRGNNWPTKVPHLPTSLILGSNIKFTQQSNSANYCWTRLIRRLKDFRQKRNSSNNQTMGRSQWSEPSAIRHLLNQHDPKFTKPIPDPLIEKFPRAVFGLPIIFEFKDGNKGNRISSQKDPQKTSLELENFSRLASPLILKPLSCSNGQFVGLAIVLNGSNLRDEQLVLKNLDGPTQLNMPVSWALDNNEELVLRADTSSNQEVLINAQTNALRAFMKYL